MKKYFPIFILVFFAFSSCMQPRHAKQPAENTDLAQWVNPFVGTAGHGHTYPGATAPFGMLQLSRPRGLKVGMAARVIIIPIVLSLDLPTRH